MAIMATWGKKKFEVSPSKINALQNLSTSFDLDVDQTRDADGNTVITHKGVKALSVKFDVLVASSAGFDVRAEIDSWKALVGKSEPLMIGTTLFSTQKFLLTGVGIGDIALDNRGRFVSAKLSIALDEADETAPAPPKLEQNETTNLTTISPGERVRILGSKYASGETVPQWAKNTAHVVSQLNGEKALLESGGTVFTKDLTLA